MRDESIKDKLEKLGINGRNKVGIMIEDYIAGENFSLYVYKKIMDETPFLANIRKELSEIQKERNIDQEEENTVHEQILISLDIKRNILADKYHESLEVANRLKEFMKDHNITIEKKIIDKVVNTVNLLNENNIYHNDLHERNIMLEFGDDGNVSDVFIIDFGKASKDERVSTDNNVIKGYEEFGK